MKKFIILFILFGTKNIFCQPNGMPRVDSLRNELFDLNEDTSKANCLGKISQGYWGINLDSAMKYAKLNLDLSLRIGFKRGISNAYNSMGVICDERGEFYQGLTYYEKSLKIRQEIGDEIAIGTIYRNIGNMYFTNGNYAEALSNILAALKIQEKINDKEGMANSWNTIGIIYGAQEDFDKSLNGLLKGLKVAQEIGDKTVASSCYNNIGRVYSALSKYDEALKNYSASLEIDQAIDDKQGEAMVCRNIGDIYHLQDNYGQALKYYFMLLKIVNSIDDKEGKSATFMRIGTIYNKEGRNKEGYEYLNKALLISIEIGRREITKDIYKWLAIADSTQGHFGSAFTNYKKYILYRDSMFNEENTKKLVQTQMKYDYDKKEDLMKIENQKKQRNLSLMAGASLLGLGFLSFIIYKRKKDSERQLSEKEIIYLKEEQAKTRAQMSPHIINNLFNDFAGRLRRLSIGEIEEQFQTIIVYSRDVLIQSDIVEVTLNRELESLHNFLAMNKTRSDIVYESVIEIDPTLETDNILVPNCIIQPFVENSLLYGIKTLDYPGIIKAQIKNINGFLNILIDDNGIGITKSKQIFEPSNKNSRGTKMVNNAIKTFCKQRGFEEDEYKLTINELVSSLNEVKGVQVKIQFPIVSIY